jgi:hypothetical protein
VLLFRRPTYLWAGVNAVAGATTLTLLLTVPVVSPRRGGLAGDVGGHGVIGDVGHRFAVLVEQAVHGSSGAQPRHPLERRSSCPGREKVGKGSGWLASARAQRFVDLDARSFRTWDLDVPAGVVPTAPTPHHDAGRR